ncbi:MAG: hypothetical protein K940chlam1_00944 [Candidatus Anoxychlamydiales bacterium]|nr:hypothetical protein [Candidatus Anoxychlamydiales bacterium]NGX35578.1 hypothetical protein [Candidatus Anoxychlamydiales bacterium]
MYKKLFSSLLIVCSLMLFVSCQQDNGKKDKKSSKSYRRGDYRKGDSNASMPTRKCQKDKPCPPPAKKSCPSGCKKKCCLNEDRAISDPKDDIAIQEMQETISVNEVNEVVKMPLEELKASLENSDALDNLNVDLE